MALSDKNLSKLIELKEKGYRYVCFGCNKFYKQKPTREYEDGHGGRLIEMCSCGSDLFGDVDLILRD